MLGQTLQWVCLGLGGFPGLSVRGQCRGCVGACVAHQPKGLVFSWGLLKRNLPSKQEETTGDEFRCGDRVRVGEGRTDF